MDVDNASVDLYNGGPKIPEGLVQIPEHEHPAFRAVRQSRIDLLEEYLNSGFDVNTQHEGMSLLFTLIRLRGMLVLKFPSGTGSLVHLGITWN